MLDELSLKANILFAVTGILMLRREGSGPFPGPIVGNGYEWSVHEESTHRC